MAHRVVLDLDHETAQDMADLISTVRDQPRDQWKASLDEAVASIRRQVADVRKTIEDEANAPVEDTPPVEASVVEDTPPEAVVEAP